MGIFKRIGSNDDFATYNSYQLFSHQTAYDRRSTPPTSPGFSSEEWSASRIYRASGFRSANSSIELRGSEMEVTEPSETSSFNLTSGTLTGFLASSGMGGAYFSTEITGISLSAADFWTLTQASAWHDIYVLAAAGDDVMTGHYLHDFIEGFDGNDVINGLEGDDSLWGNDGRDFLYGGLGNDILVGNDWSPGASSDLWNECWGGEGDDLVFTGGYGSGYLVGDGGVDRLWGAGQSDVIEGGAGGDYLSGGGGLDIFKVKYADMQAGEIDMVLDFQDGVDYIQLAPNTIYSLVDSAYGAFLGVTVPGGSWGMLFSYNTASQVADQIFLAA